jgi:hypothetical protein
VSAPRIGWAKGDEAASTTMSDSSMMLAIGFGAAALGSSFRLYSIATMERAPRPGLHRGV